MNEDMPKQTESNHWAGFQNRNLEVPLRKRTNLERMPFDLCKNFATFVVRIVEKFNDCGRKYSLE